MPDVALAANGYQERSGRVPPNVLVRQTEWAGGLNLIFRVFGH